jgi:predicted nucleic acid-binding protein
LALTLEDRYIILDNNIIFDFGVLDDFVLLNRILANNHVIMSPEVREEVKREIKIENLTCKLQVCDSEADYLHAAALRKEQKGLSVEDISCLVLAKKFEGICATNDKLVRKVAKRESIPVIGSIGLLECAIEQKTVTLEQAAEILLKTIENGAFIEKKLVDNFLGRR